MGIHLHSPIATNLRVSLFLSVKKSVSLLLFYNSFFFDSLRILFDQSFMLRKIAGKKSFHDCQIIRLNRFISRRKFYIFVGQKYLELFY
jgi:hypothetical protein